MNYKKDIIRLSNRLDSIGLYREASISDKILVMASENNHLAVRNNMVTLADHLDRIGSHKESDYIDLFLKKHAFDMSSLGEIPDMIGGFVDDTVDAAIREFKETVVLYLLSSLGMRQDSYGAEFIANLIAALTFEDMKTIYYSEDKCLPITKEIVAALEKTLLEKLLTGPFLQKAEDKLEVSLKDLFGVEEGGWVDTSLEKAINGELIEEMFTFYLTQDSALTNKISELICGYIKDFSLPSLWEEASDGVTSVLESVSDYLPNLSDIDLTFWD